MKLRVRAFGVSRDILGGTVVEIDVPSNRVADLRSVLLSRYPELRGLQSLLIAVNQNYAPEDLELMESDEIALIPPVSGG